MYRIITSLAFAVVRSIDKVVAKAAPPTEPSKAKGLAATAALPAGPQMTGKYLKSSTPYPCSSLSLLGSNV